ncbi:MAG: hypothetical protein AABX47_05035 [Nanoarchaeota archaeon]
MVLEPIGIWMGEHYLLASVIVLVASLYLLEKASDYIVIGISGYAQTLGLSDSLIGFLVVSLAMTLPEFVSSLIGNQSGEPGIVFGTILGSGVVSITVILGTLAVLGGRVRLKEHLLGEIRPLILPMVALPLILSWDGAISRIDGSLLLLAFIIFVVVLWKEEGTMGQMKERVPMKTLYKDAFIFLFALAALLLAARFLVFSSIVLAHEFGVPTYLMALTVIAIGASVGDFMLDVRSLAKGRKDIAVGDVLGGIIVGNTLALGIIAMISPIKANVWDLAPAYFFFLIPLAGVMHLIKRGSMSRRHGVWLLSTYVAFLVVQIFVMR